ncbi:acyl-CoA dehydrogenase family protein [Hungatella hathewayi]|uniref:acyl-CoA dehydrogenase family protein n=1 Tax=Hungatella hathewayi TaxID=154046 RepID=UPI00356A4016
MNFEISSEQKELCEEIIRFAKNVLNKEDNETGFPYKKWEEMSEFGIFGLNISEEYGGLNESYLTSAMAIEALGYACTDNGLIFAVNNHIWVGLNMINIYGNSDLKKRYLPDMVAGKRIGAIAITEADAGSDVFAMKTTAIETDNGFILNGSKMFVSNGTIADVFVVFAKVKMNKKEKFTAFIVDKSLPGITIGSDIKKMGLHNCPTAEVIFDQCIIPKMNVLGEEGKGDLLLQGALEWERCYEFASYVGAMQRVMEKCLEYANERRQFGKYISEFQAVSHKIADMKSKIELARLMLYKIAWLKDCGKKAYTEASIFKVFVSESYIQTCRDAMQIFGAYGYTEEYGIVQELQDALACSIHSGTNEMQKNTIYNMSLIDIMR